MAIVEIKNPGSLRIRFHLGMENGKAQTRSRTYSNLKTNAAGQDVYDVAEAIVGLQEYNVLEIIKQDYTSLNA